MPVTLEYTTRDGIWTSASSRTWESLACALAMYGVWKAP
eukprot:CAMPEP_0195587016 /NCGR_PEP_ID=MMETSP0814-20130614/30272_1 /TAXON_ID=97485 /ORGANISM="Prymnesium parvum, Strain Texoma1" /LENGTH=38 /DNA_ID= /DNA_START= /DNA_END= /DNA_ORIENTATION=